MVFISGKIRLAWFGDLLSGPFVPPDRYMTTGDHGVIDTDCRNVFPIEPS